MIKSIFTTILTALILLLTQNIYASVKIYLFPEVVVAGSSVTIGDIAFVEGNGREILNKIKIPDNFVDQGIIDRKVINAVISETFDLPFIVFGNGVNIKISKIDSHSSLRLREILINNGDSVGVIIVNNGVRIETRGRALGSGGFGDLVKVRVGKNRVLDGVVAGKAKVVMELQ